VRLGGLLERRGAELAYVYLPAGEGGAKTGLDDYLAAGGTVDGLVQRARPEPINPDPEPASQEEPLPRVERDEGEAILDDVAGAYRRYVAWANDHQAVAVTLWTAHTHAIDAADTTPYLQIESAEPESGKSRVLEVAELLAARAWRTIEPSEAALFRKIEQAKPTLLLDEVDALWGGKADGREGIRAMLNEGYRRGATVPRVVGEGVGMGVQDFNVFGAKALAGLAGKLPRTVATRSIPVRLQRRAKGEPVAKFRQRTARDELTPIHQRLAAWVKLVLPELEGAYPDVPESLSDRQGDCWEALLAVADAAGGDWPKRARAAAVELHGRDPAADPSNGVLLLGHVLEAFMDAKTERLATTALLEALVAREDGPWAEWWGEKVDEGKTKGPAAKLAKMLKPYGIAPHKRDIGGEKVRGYALEDLDDATTRYLPPPVPSSDTEPRNPAGQSAFGDGTTAELVPSPQAADQQGSLVPSPKTEPGPGRDDDPGGGARPAPAQLPGVQQQADPLTAWIADRCVIGPVVQHLSDLHGDYRDWCALHRRKPLGRIAFDRSLGARGHVPVGSEQGPRGRRFHGYRVGIALRVPPYARPPSLAPDLAAALRALAPLDPAIIEIRPNGRAA
jgi:Protein of unknown function (DUF3631)